MPREGRLAASRVTRTPDDFVHDGRRAELPREVVDDAFSISADALSMPLFRRRLHVSASPAPGGLPDALDAMLRCLHARAATSYICRPGAKRR